MQREKIAKIAHRWFALTHSVLDLKKIETSEFQTLLAESYRAAKLFCRSDDIPKELCRLMLSIRDFLYFASLLENKEVGLDFYHYIRIDCIVNAIENGLFKGVFEYRFPSAEKKGETLVLDFENDGECFVNFASSDDLQGYSGIKLIGYDFIADEA